MACGIMLPGWRPLGLLLGSLAISGGTGAIAQERYEAAPTFHAAKILPAELLSGPHHRVEDRVVNDGFMNRYTIESDFGSFEANSDAELRIRVGEVGAIARLEEVSRSEQFTKGVGKAGQDMLSAATGAIQDPLDTLSQTTSGVKEVFGSLGRTLRGKGSGGVREAVGYGRAKREYALAFGVDPYSTNPVLQDQLSRVSRAGFVGDVGAGTALGLASGGTGTALSAAGHVQSLKDLVGDKSPGELRAQNEEKLQTLGVETKVTERFLTNQAFSPTAQTAFVETLAELEGVANRDEFVEAAARAKNADEALFRALQARMYASYHKSVKRLRSFVPISRRVAIAGRTGNGTLVVAAPADYVTLARRLARDDLEARGGIEQGAGAAGKQLWIAGGMSPLARQWFKDNGWAVHANARKRLLPPGR